MRADLYTKNSFGNEVAYFRDSYNNTSLLATINNVLGWTGSLKALSWSDIATESEDEQGHVKMSVLMYFHDQLEQAFIEALQVPQWKRPNGAPLTEHERQLEIARLVELMTQVRLAQKTGNYMIWSV